MNKRVYITIWGFLSDHSAEYINIREIVKTKKELVLVDSSRKAFRFDNRDIHSIYITTELC